MERNGEKEREKVWRGRRDYRRQEREKTQFEGVVLRSNLAIGQSKMKTCWTRFYARSTAWKDSELLPNRTLISQMASKPWCTRWRRNAKVFATAFGGKWGRPCRNWSVYIGNKFSKLSKERSCTEKRCPILSIRPPPGFSKTSLRLTKYKQARNHILPICIQPESARVTSPPSSLGMPCLNAIKIHT